MQKLLLAILPPLDAGQDTCSAPIIAEMKSAIHFSVGFPQRLRELRDLSWLSRAEFLAKHSLGSFALWMLENGFRAPNWGQLESMHKAGLDITYLLHPPVAEDKTSTYDPRQMGRCAIVVSQALNFHHLRPSSACYWRLVRLLYTEAVNDAQLKQNCGAG
ncbi:hypothetical protein [Polaromonas sp. JS666]|uniref:hypothetical protein n=1 Tax=Polaromonas sp. (strain JS666 / ATCC BAA-500) TaxID=296591 RepID=UPI000053255E|nr:hypothetical protein [Polaromonas sp. JS666]